MSSPMSGVTQLTIDVISDIVCPWCYVGKLQLEQALKSFEGAHPELPTPIVRWHPFQLNPDLPAEGIARADYLQTKFGDELGNKAIAKVKEAGETIGLTLQMDKIVRQPNTVKAHAVISVAQESAQEIVVQGFFEAFFNAGQDPTEEANLIEIARAGGISEPAIEAAINDVTIHDTIRRADTSARDLGVQNIPFFIFNQKIAVNGAVGADTLFAAAVRAVSLDPDDENQTTH